MCAVVFILNMFHIEGGCVARHMLRPSRRYERRI